MPTKPKTFSSVQKWQQHVDAQLASGLTQAAYCREHALSAASFGWWKRKLQGQTPAAPEKSAVPKTPTLVPVRIIAESEPVPSNNLSESMLIHFPNGITAEITLTEDTLPRVLELVGSLKC